MLFRICAVLCNFYPRPPRGGRPVCFAAGRVSVSISIHALREEGDEAKEMTIEKVEQFLSTPSARRATIPVRRTVWLLNDFYPRPPRGGRPPKGSHRKEETGDFYPRPPRGGRRSSQRACRSRSDFYPRPPRGGRPWRLNPKTAGERFLSTPSARRATRAGAQRRRPYSNFYPRPPRGGRRRRCSLVVVGELISIHALREEGDGRGRH